MWIKKSPEEVRGDLRARRLSAGLGVVCVAFVLFVFGLPHVGFHVPASARIAAILTTGIILLAVHQRAHWRDLHSSVWVCEQCNAVRANKDQATCVCGGRLTPLCEMNWLETPFREIPAPVPNAENALPSAHAI
jgi:hypothetical protein